MSRVHSDFVDFLCVGQGRNRFTAFVRGPLGVQFTVKLCAILAYLFDAF